MREQRQIDALAGLEDLIAQAAREAREANPYLDTPSYEGVSDEELERLAQEDEREYALLDELSKAFGDISISEDIIRDRGDW